MPGGGVSSTSQCDVEEGGGGEGGGTPIDGGWGNGDVVRGRVGERAVWSFVEKNNVLLQFDIKQYTCILNNPFNLTK